ncbi:MAG: metallophosphoesterase family protein [Phycisphaerales bacterium]
MTRIGLISDIHSNLEALEAVLCDVSLAGVDTLVCLGDITGYGPNPSECVELIRDTCDLVVLGNHDEAMINPKIGARFRGSAKLALDFNRDALTIEQLTWLQALPERAETGDLSVTHACFGPNKYDYLYSKEIASQAFTYMPTRFGAVGHTHLPSTFHCCAQSQGLPEQITMEAVVGRAKVAIPETCRMIINPGSVGQPRDRNPDASWAVLDTDASTFQIRRVWYDVMQVERKVLASGLPVAHAERLRIGA